MAIRIPTINDDVYFVRPANILYLAQRYIEVPEPRRPSNLFGAAAGPPSLAFKNIVAHTLGGWATQELEVTREVFNQVQKEWEEAQGA